MTRKLSFLPVFFAVLGVVFAVLVFVRIRSYQADTAFANATAGTTATAATDATAGSALDGTTESTGGMTLTPVGADGTYEEVDTTGGAANGNGTRSSAREERYNQLLRGAVPTAPIVNATTAPRSAIAPPPRVTQTPVTQAPPAVAPPRPTPTPPPVRSPALIEDATRPPRSGSNESRNGSNESRNGSGDGADPEPADPDSDVTPPQLMGAEFQPPQVKDGETTTLVAVVMDDLSGVATVSGVIASPSGALQGFACQRDAAEPNRFIARITVPAEAAEGVWRINYLTLADNARNSVNLSAAQGMLPPTAIFRVVSSRPDSAGPSLKSVWVDRPAMRAGERNTIFVQAEDEKSGVSVVSGVLLSPSQSARIGFGCRANSSGVWECQLSPPTCLDCGVWMLEQVQLQDKAGNMTTFRNDNPMVKALAVDISGESCDARPPQLTSLVLDPTTVSNTEAMTVTARAIVTDDTCGISSISGQAVGPGAGANAPRLYFSFERSGDAWIARISVPKHAAKGQWKIAWVQVLDIGHNLKAYSDRDPALTGVGFRVQ